MHIEPAINNPEKVLGDHRIQCGRPPQHLHHPRQSSQAEYTEIWYLCKQIKAPDKEGCCAEEQLLHSMNNLPMAAIHHEELAPSAAMTPQHISLADAKQRKVGILTKLEACGCSCSAAHLLLLLPWR